MNRRIIAGTAVWLASMMIGGISTVFADVQMKEVVVTATKTERKQQDLTQSVTVITADDIQKSGAQNVAEVMSTTAGAMVTDQGPLGSLQSITLRGSTYQQVLVLLDGKRLNSASAGGYDLSELPVPLDAIDRIEIVRGPSSALYGADAVGGVVNIITKKPAKSMTTLSGTLGAHVDIVDTSVKSMKPETNHVSLYNTGREGNTYYSLSYSKDYSNGYRVNSDANQYNAGIKAGYDFDAASSIEATFDYMRKAIGVPGSVQLSSDVARQTNYETVMGLQYKGRLSKVVDINVRVFQNEDRLHFENSDFSEYSQTRSTTSGAEAQVNWIMNSFSVLTVGAEGRADSMVDSSSGSHRASISSLYIQDEISMGNSFILVLGDRNDKHSVFGNKWSPKASGRYLISGSGTILRASYGNSFRAPTLNDLYFTDAFGNKGNPDLKPETAVEYEGGIEQPFGSGNSIKFTAFTRRVKDLIIWQPIDPANPFTYTPMNIGRARISGTETELHFVVAQNLAGNFSYTLMFPVDESTGERLFSDNSHIPASQLGGTLWTYLDSQTVLALDGRWVKNYVRPNEPKWEYYTLDAKITDTVVAQKDLTAQVFIGMKNIFDRQYETVKGYPMPPQQLYGGVTATF
jgi:outer membrane cobalamin receptor